MKIVHLDYGHGGRDSGATGNELLEKDVVLSVGTKVTDTLEQHNVKVTHSRTDDKFIELSERARMANSDKAHVFVSLHCNDAENKQAQGVEVFSYPNSVEGKKIAQLILDNIVSDKVYTKNRGVKTANFAVLRLTKMPSCLVELGFIGNIADSNILRNRQDELALSVAKGILSYLGITYKAKPATDPYNEAIDKMVAKGIISSPDLWKDETYNKNHVKSLIIKIAAML